MRDPTANAKSDAFDKLIDALRSSRIRALTRASNPRWRALTKLKTIPSVAAYRPQEVV